MKELFEKLHKLQAISSTNSKKQFIKANRKDELFTTTLEFLLNPYKITNISKKKIEKKVRGTTLTVSNLYGFYHFLTNGCTGKDSDIALIQKFINNNIEFENELKELSTKSMKLGCKAKIVNDALGYNLIPDFGCMLGESYFKNENKVKESFILTTKLDGSRILILKERGKVKCYSRQGQLIEGLNDIVSDVEQMDFNNGVLDGELVAIGEFNDSADMYKETMKRSRIKGVKSGLKVMVYDYIKKIDCFYKGVDNTPCLYRKIKLEELINQSDCKYIEYLKPLYIGTDKKEIYNQLQIAKDKNEEGIMLNISDSKYECKRSKNLLKCKLMQSCDLKIIGFEEGQGRLKNTLGKLICDYKGFELGVGSGFSDELRKEIWNNQNKYLGRVSEIQYFEQTNNDKGELSLRFPVFKCMREEGKEISYE